MEPKPLSAIGPAALDVHAWKAALDRASREAARGCGGSDYLWIRSLSRTVTRMVDVLPEEQRTSALAIAANEGYYAPQGDLEAEVVGPDECPTTGITNHACPCGRHD